MYMLDVADIIDEPHHDETLIAKPLPPGTWEIVCTSKEATCDQAYEIVEQDDEGFKDYNKTPLNFMCDIPFLDPLPSLASLMTSKGFDINKNYLILKKQ
jgi:hypothetical protein